MTNKEKEVLLHLDRLPFFVGIIDPAHPPNLPATLPFSLYVDEYLAIPRMVRTLEIDSALESAYRFGSMLSTPLGESKLATERMTELIALLTKKSGGSLKGKFFVEIGAGNGVLLNAVRDCGADVIGFEIGPQAQEARNRFNLSIIQEAFDPKYLPSKVDCIFSYGCLEHIYEPQEFIDVARSALKSGGLFFHNVPNSTLLFKIGSIQGLCHEHVNYFTSRNSIRLFEARGFVGCGAQSSQAGNELNIWGYNNPDAVPYWPGDIQSELYLETELLREYGESVQMIVHNQVERLKSRVSRLNGRKIGFYAGGHVLVSLADIGQHSRFFDGDEVKWGKCWLDGLSAIEPPLNLQTNTLDTLIVCSEHYFDTIYAHLREEIGLSVETEIIKLSQL